ncbi:MAG: phosphatidylglycerophosphatase A [Sedimentisphaerales bacterium]|nr:phosphatidylglycerophosphatase A [Sedimentisphaerales bacterium]
MTKFKQNLCILTATCLGLGYLPIASGTWGTLLAVAAYWLIVFAAPMAWQIPLIAVALLASSTATIAVTPWAEKYWNKKDPGRVVMDEVAGFLLTVLVAHIFFPAAATNIWLFSLWAFIATRVFDIIKIPPARQLEKLPHGWGVLLDDLWSSLYAAAFLWICFYICPGLFGAMN